MCGGSKMEVRMNISKLALALISFMAMNGCTSINYACPAPTSDAGLPLSDAATILADAAPMPTQDAGSDAGTDAHVEPDAFAAPDAHVAPLGRYAFCDPWTPDVEHRGGFRGCCAIEGVFPTADHVEPGMLVKGSGSQIYYIANDGNRYVFPTTQFLTSWYLDPSRDVRFGRDDYACGQVTQIPDELLASIRINGNVPMRPGVVTVAIITDPASYVVDHGNVLRRIADPTVTYYLAEPWLRGRDIMMMDGFFVTFCVGETIINAELFDGDRLYREATIQYEIDHYCGT